MSHPSESLNAAKSSGAGEAAHWHAVPARIVPGHGVASGRNGNPKFPGGTIRMQLPHLRARGLDLDAYHPGTVNLSIAPATYRVLKARITIRKLDWHPIDPPEDFSFFDARLVMPDGRRISGLIYYPHPETKPTHFQQADILELLLPLIPGIEYGQGVTLEVDAAQLQIGQAAK